jgi:hypothetical protein
MSLCQPCAPPDVVIIVSVRLLEYLCCLCGRHVACLLLLAQWHNRALASGQYTITPEDGREVEICRRLIENKK